MSRSLVLVALTIALASCGRTPGDPPPRSFLRGGVWFSAATGYWFHQYAERDEIERLMQDLAFTCNEATKADETRLRCERGFRMPGGVLSRTDYVQFGFRRSGAVASAESDCRYAFFDAPSLSGTCAPFRGQWCGLPECRNFRGDDRSNAAAVAATSADQHVRPHFGARLSRDGRRGRAG